MMLIVKVKLVALSKNLQNAKIEYYTVNHKLMKNNYEIEKSNYFEKPFPYIVKDNFLDVSLLNDINKNWPEDKYFFDEIEGIRLLDLEYSVKKK